MDTIQSLFSIPEPKPFDELLSLKGRSAIVTGGGRGLGKYVVRRFAEAGANVVFCARHADQLQEVASEFAALPGELAPIVADVSSADDRKRLVDEAVSRFGGIDILVNCAAIYPPGDSFSVTGKTWDAMLDIDTKAAFFMSTAVARQMIAQRKGGRIVSFLSTAFVNAAPMFSAYAIAKAGVWEMTRVLSKELAPHRITVNAVTPGATLTEEKAAALANGNFEEAASALGMTANADIDIEALMKMVQKMGGPAAIFKQRIPMGRMGYPEDLANAVLYLASDMASYVTGQNIVVDGAQVDNSTLNPFAASTAGTEGASVASGEAAETASSDEASVVDPGASSEPDPGMAGTWKAKVNTPMGTQEVEVDAHVDGTTLSGTMLFMGKKLDIQNGIATKAGFSYEVHIKVMLKKLDAIVSGTRDGDTLTGTIDNPMGSFAFTAERA